MSRKLVSYRLADDLQQALKERAGSEGISATELVNRLLRQGLMENAAGDTMQQRVSQLEQVLHQLEKRVLDRSVDYRSEGGLMAPAPEALGLRLLTLEQKLDALLTDVEEGCSSLKQLSRMVQGIAAGGLPNAPGLSTPESTTYSPELSQDVVHLPLAALRKLLSSDPLD
jgi:hypothetical protein